MKLHHLIMALFLMVVITACEKVNPNFQAEAENAEYLHRSMKKLTDVIVHDIFSPPQASRIYAYASLAAYQAAQPGFSEYKSLDGQLKQYVATPKPEEGKEY
ncbi:MAG: phosphatidic acid phosphatase, partial [Bacteroidota bacterium]